MMIRSLLLILPLLALTACGVQRPLIAPKDIPAHEERLKRKRQRLEDTPVTVQQLPTDATSGGMPASPETPIAPGSAPATGGKAE